VTSEASFQAHVELLEFFLARRSELVERIQALLNAQRKPVQFLRDRPSLSRHFDDCFFTLPGIRGDHTRLKGQLERAHWARGFKPREIPGMHNDLADPAEMMRRAFHLWTQTRWPGRSTRDHYALTLFNLYLVRQLALLGMRTWNGRADSGSGARDPAVSDAGERLAEVQRVLDALWKTAPPNQPVFVRDARWLIPVAHSYATDDLAPYLEIAQEISDAFSENDRTEIQKAVVRMAGGHLRSYLHYYVTQKGVPLDDSRLVQITRKSNALDYSLLIQGLAPLLEAYERAAQRGDAEQRLELADAICQGMSPDPELFVNRVDLLGAYSMVEHLFTTTDAGGHAAYTPMGQHHVRLLDDYATRFDRVAKALHEDCARFRPVDGAYSPYGALYGFSSNLLEHMALRSLQPDAETRFSLEDVFSAGDADKLAWVNGWRKLPHVDPEVAKLYAYPQKFAEQIFTRVEQALRQRATDAAEAMPRYITDGTPSDAAQRTASNASRTGRLFVLAEGDSAANSEAPAIPDLPIHYIQSSDNQLVAANKAEACDQAQLLKDRVEGHFVLSYATQGGWVAIAKDLLTEVLGAGRDAKIVGLPDSAVERLRLTCRHLVSGAR
jgi:hypothetical protein